VGIGEIDKSLQKLFSEMMLGVGELYDSGGPWKAFLGASDAGL
jgi:hypothetical protein